MPLNRDIAEEYKSYKKCTPFDAKNKKFMSYTNKILFQTLFFIVLRVKQKYPISKLLR